MNIVYMAKSAWTGLLDTIRSKAGITGSMTVSQAAEAVENIPTGGGGSNIITGDFTTQSTEGEQEVTIPYNGSGYPVYAVFYCEDKTILTGANLCVGAFAFYKTDKTIAPMYTGSTKDNSNVTSYYRYSTSAASRYTVSSTSNKVFMQTTGTQASDTLKVTSNNKILLKVDNASIGFPTNATYHYFIEYSS